ncbi:hypothetical protein [Pectobacterium sp. B1J-3]|uniref:hypothetical protein n=1 Tax=Pectobacterium sp. B1J-3 TaxID=3385371 RepID=UPI0039058E23
MFEFDVYTQNDLSHRAEPHRVEQHAALGLLGRVANIDWSIVACIRSPIGVRALISAQTEEEKGILLSD